MTENDAPASDGRGSRVSRRAFLGAAGAAGVAAGAVAGGIAIGRATESDASPALPARIPFYGEHQAGIATPVQNRLFFASMDVTAEHTADVRELMRTWTAAIADMAEGRPVGQVEGDAAAPPEDTGEATGLPASRLTVTVGLGPTLFERDGEDRLGLAHLRPGPLEEIPPLPQDNLDPLLSGGDLSVQACADDPVVAFHAVRNLARLGRGVVVTRWTQVGFGRTASGGPHDPTPRNLQGFKDGTNNIAIADTEALNRFVWVGSAEQPAWMRGGTYQVARRIRMFIDAELGATVALVNDNMDGVEFLPGGLAGLRIGYDIYSQSDSSPSRTFEAELLVRAIAIQHGSGALLGIGFLWGN